jgi:septal ring factor EnvC (AmiA/AmiB activator)
MFEEMMSIVEESNEPNRGGKVVDRFGGSLVNIILGALILWVGQTTFLHAGQLASADERFQSVNLQFNAVDGRHATLRELLEQASSETHDRTQSRFTKEDGEKLEASIKELQDVQIVLERQLTQRVTNLQIQLTALEANGGNQHEISILRAEVERMCAFQAYGPGNGYSAGRGAANTVPTYLPPVSQNR